jgi:hypothetical protein
MLKKLLILLPLYVAFGIVMAHNLIPHNHNHEFEVAEYHHPEDAEHRHGHDDEGEGDKDLAHGFEFFHHAGTTIQFVPSQICLNKIFNALDFAFLAPVYFDIRPCESPHTPFGFSPQTNSCSFLLCPQSGLRAPPCIG